MAKENLESLDNFSIENTMEMSMGNAQQIDDFLSSESVTGNPEDIKETKKEEEVVIPEKKTEETKSSGQDILNSFLENEEEEEETETKKEEVKKEETVEIPAEQEESQFEALARDLISLGVFGELEEGEEEIKTPEQFLEKFNKEKQKGAISIVDNFIGQFGADYKQAFDAIFVKGADPKEYFSTYNNIVSFAEMDLSKEDNQIAVMRKSLSDNGLEDEDVESTIEQLKNYGDLEVTAAKHHKALVKKEAQKLQEVEKKAQERLQQKQATRQQFVNNVQTILQDKLKTKDFDGIPLNQNLVNELEDFLLTDKWTNSAGDKLSDFDKTLIDLQLPKNHAQKVKVALLLKLLEKDPTLSTIQKSGISKKSGELFGSLAKQQSNKTTKVTNVQPNKWFV